MTRSTTAELLELIEEFITSTDTTVRLQLGRFLIARCNEEDTTDPGTESAIVIHQLTEAAELLHTLAGHPDEKRAE